VKQQEGQYSNKAQQWEGGGKGGKERCDIQTTQTGSCSKSSLVPVFGSILTIREERESLVIERREERREEKREKREKREEREERRISHVTLAKCLDR
jgi:hypothetical protein